MADENQSGDKTAGAPNYDSAKYWIGRVTETKKVFKKRWWNAAKEAWNEYEIGEDSDEEASYEGTGERVRFAKIFPLFWSSVKTLAPAYYSKTPIPVSQIRFGITDEVSRTAAKLQERLGTYGLETTSFDEVMRDSTLELILSDCVTTRVMLEADPIQVPLQQAEEGEGYVKEDGSPYDGQMIGQDQDGAYYGQDGYQNQKCYPMALSYGDIMWTHSASCSEDIDEIFYKFCYSEQEAYEMFPDIDPEELKGAMKTYGKEGDKANSNDKKTEAACLYLHGWEIWHKPTKMVRFVSEDYKPKLLKKKEDPYKLKDFFPSPCPIQGTKQRKSLFGIPSFRYLKPLCDEMHSLVERIFSLSDEARVRFVCDGEYEVEIREAVQSEEGIFIFIKNLMSIVEKGGLNNVIQALPVGDLQRSLQQLAALLNEFKQLFYEIYGVPDVVRGMSDPIETAKAQEIKSFSASNRFRDQMNQVASLARDTLELLIDLKLGAYPPQKILQATGAQYMEPADQQRIPQAYAILQNDSERMIRLDFETDSTSYINEQIEQSNRNVAIQTVTQGLAAINGMPPTQQAIGFKAVQSALSGLRLGKEFMDDIDALMNQLMEQAKNPPPPPPNVEMMKVEIEKQKLQLKAQEQAQKGQESQVRLQLDQMKVALDQRIEEFKLQVDSQAKMADQSLEARDLQRKEMESQVEMQKTLNDAALEQAKGDLDRAIAEFSMLMEAQRLKIEQSDAKMAGLERLMEESRLAKQQEVDMLKTVIDAERAKPEAQPIVIPSPEMPAINITNEIKPRKKRGSMTRQDGTRVDFETEDVDE